MKKQLQRSFVFVLCMAVIITQAQNVGIGTNTPKAKLHTIGSVRFDTLSGIGTRAIYTDSAGNLIGSVPLLPASTVTNSTAIPIPDFNCPGVSSNIALSQLPNSITSASIGVNVNITHPQMKDLSIYLLAPNGSILNLFLTSTSSANLVNTLFTDGGDLLSNGFGSYTGPFKPSGDLSVSICGIAPTVTTFSAMGGGTINPNGTWTLRIVDNIATNTGTLNNWSVSVNPGIGQDGVWGLKGNSGANENNFIGTLDNTPLRFRIKNINAGIIDSVNSNTAIGFRALDSIYVSDISRGNTAFGTYALKVLKNGSRNTAFGVNTFLNLKSGSDNTAIGVNALSYGGTVGGDKNVAIGAGAMLNGIQGSSNIAIGYLSMANSNGSSIKNNIAVGENALGSNLSYSNIGIGSNALYNNSDRNNLVAIGDSALYNNGIGAVNSIDATFNTAIGSKALFSNTTGYYNTATGSGTLHANIVGVLNTATGAQALYNNNVGSYNTASGAQALYNNISGSYNTATGRDALLHNQTGDANTANGDGALNYNQTGYANTASGAQSLNNNLDGHDNTGIGYAALFTNVSGVGNTGTGNYSLYYNTGSNNSANGFQALYHNMGGNNNTATGFASLFNNTTGNGNIANGFLALFNNTYGYSNIAIGDHALFSSTYQLHNTAIGDSALYSNGIGAGLIPDGSENVAIGFKALWSNTTGWENTATGLESLLFNSTGVQNTAIGYDALAANISGNENTALGYSAGVAVGNLNNATAIGANATVGTSNTIQLGDGFVTSVNTSGSISAHAYRCKPGATGAFRGNVFNIDWTLGGAAQLWIDVTNLGTISFTSDRRLKENIDLMKANGIERMMELKPVHFMYKKIEGTIFSGSTQEQEGFIADELQQVIPSAVNGDKNALTSKGTIQPQTVNIVPVVAVLTKAVQEQQQMIEDLKKEKEEQNRKIELLLKEMQLIKEKLK